MPSQNAALRFAIVSLMKIRTHAIQSQKTVCIVTYLSFYAPNKANGIATGLITRRKFKLVFCVWIFACFL